MPQATLRQREQILSRLEAQPEWFNYFAAFMGAILSTLVMHPIDTIKTRTARRLDSSGEYASEDSLGGVESRVVGD